MSQPTIDFNMGSCEMKHGPPRPLDIASSAHGLGKKLECVASGLAALWRIHNSRVPALNTSLIHAKQITPLPPAQFYHPRS
jgi:hypothetical protein